MDAAACRESRLVEAYLGPDRDDDLRDALADHVDWAHLAGEGGWAYVNAPYTPVATLRAFLAKAVATADAGTPVIGLLPASVCSRWWADFVTATPNTIVEYLPGRLQYDGPHARGGSAPWGAALAFWGTPAGFIP